MHYFYYDSLAHYFGLEVIIFQMAELWFMVSHTLEENSAVKQCA
jgi:hypothetical protein